MKHFNLTFCALCAVACWATTPGRAAARANDDSSMVAVRDPQSGLLRPATPAEIRALNGSAMASRPAPGPVMLRSDGRRQVHLGEAGLVHAVLQRDADGSVAMACSDSEQRAALQGDRHER